MNNTKHYKFIIIGAGPTGLGAAYNLTKINEKSFLVIEKENEVGGLAKSYTDSLGFTWDIGGHVLFSHYKYFDQALQEAIDSDEWIHHQRHASVFLDNTFIDYPFQNNIHQLPKELSEKCLNDLTEVQRTTSNPINFEEWITSNFGETISKIFMLPYNFKVWGHPANIMSINWMKERVATIDIEKIKQNFITGKADTNWGPNNRFSFPKNGGTGAIWKGFEKLINQNALLKNRNLNKVDYRHKTITTSKSETFSYDYLLNTIPLKSFSQFLYPQIDSISESASLLSTNVSHILGFGFKGDLPIELQNHCWIYFPEDNTPFYRVTILSKYSPSNAPRNHWSLLCEVTESFFKKINKTTIVNETLNGLKKTILKNISFECVNQWYFSTNPGYPVPSFDRDDLLKTIHKQLAPYSIFSRGRFGGHKYEVSNMDHSFMQGVEWTEWIINGTVEKTYKQ